MQLRCSLSLLFGFLSFVYADNEASGELLSDVEEQQHTRAKFFNWDYKDLGTSSFEDISFSPRQPFGQTDLCPDGWLKFSDSCYYIEQETMGFAKAEKRCFDKKATLFVANSLDEWDAIRQHSPKAFFSWIGLVRFSQYEKSEQLPRWQTEGGVNPARLNWLIRPYKPLSNGWTTYANCAVHYNPAVSFETASYVFYYPCTFMMHSICERNTTLINAANNRLFQ
ncbi:unnamed protein product [Caenorhabditis bovis]|uniref:C-type lectin domain-containing protein n=1 Tax=Caenorhabditis bovis TaxID=2654633 RepID=A0A8S1EW36_9PELO|nr:unnamed protein product [Caenorhabditis bovis]